MQQQQQQQLNQYIIQSGLQNNPEAEIFPLVHSLRNVVSSQCILHMDLGLKLCWQVFPIQYIKIVPLATYGPNFNYSIWHVDLRGHSDPKIMELVMNEYQSVSLSWLILQRMGVIKTGSSYVVS